MAFDPTTAKPVKKKFDPNTAVAVPSLAESGEPPQVPWPSEFGPRPIDISPVDAFKKPVLAAFSEGWDEGRGGDRVLGLNPENRGKVAGGWFDLPASSLRAGLEIGEGLYGGLKRATGQAIYNSGLSQSSPASIADKAFELPEYYSLVSPTGLGALTRLPRLANGVPLTSRIPVLGPALDRRAAAARAEQVRRAELQALADRHDVNLMPADVSGPMTRGLTAGARQTSIGGAFIDSAANRANRQMSEAVRTVAGRQGNVTPPMEAGEALQRGARTFSTRTAEQGGRMYRQAHAQAGNVQIDPSRTVNYIDSEIARLSQSRVPGRAYPEIDELQAFRDRLTRQGGLNLEGMQQILSDAKTAGRTDALRGTPVSRILGDVARRGAEDVDVSLTLAGRRRAAQLYRRANAFWRDRVETIDDVLEPILGEGKSGEDVVRSIVDMAATKKGGVRRLSRVLSSMPAADANNARATIINRLGMASSSQQNADQNVFNTSTFLTNWSNMSPEGQRALFGNNPRVAQELNDLARLAEAKKLTASYANTSNTARGVNYGQALGEAGAAILSGTYLGVAPTLAALALNIGGGALLASPGFARILANAPRTAASAAQRQRVLTNLRALAAREPGLGPYIDKVSEAVSNPQPQIDYSRGDATSPTLIDPATLTEEELAAAGPAPLPQEEVDIPDIALPAEPTMAPSPDLQ